MRGKFYKTMRTKSKRCKNYEKEKMKLKME